MARALLLRLVSCRSGIGQRSASGDRESTRTLHAHWPALTSFSIFDDLILLASPRSVERDKSHFFFPHWQVSRPC